MIPEVSKLKQAIENSFLQGVAWAETYKGWFAPNEQQNREKINDAIRRALEYLGIDIPDPEPLPLWGVKPILQDNETKTGLFWFDYGDRDTNELFISTKPQRTVAEAITAWNRIATALNEIGEK